jgi:hypothetical protein
MVSEPLWLQATGGDPVINYSATNDRALIDAMFASQGTLGDAAFKVSQRGVGANFSVDIAVGYAVILGDDAANQGKYLVQTTATVNCVTPAAPGSGTRVHRVIARIRDKQALGSGTYDWSLELLEDTGSGTPAEPNSSITLATVSIASGQASVQNSNITDLRPIAQLYNTAGLLVDTTLTTAAATVTFNNIPQNYRHLMLICELRSSAAGTSPIDSTVRLNNDSGLFYSGAHIDLPMGGSLGSVTANGQAQAATFMMPANGVSANVGGSGLMWLLNYSNTNWRTKHWIAFSSATDFGSIGDMKLRWATYCPNSPAAVTRIDVTCGSGNFVANSYLALYGYGN